MMVLGIMSGTSLDGLDLAMCSFEKDEGGWNYHLLYTGTVPYSGEWIRKLTLAPGLPGMELHLLDIEYGNFIADNVLEFMLTSGMRPELIASHGHTVFHQPGSSFTLQIGNPQAIACRTGIRTAGNFREMDVFKGGQGAPLVPVGDELLFGNFDYCLNIGGFANISYNREGRRLARDICPANTILNHFARDLELSYDDEGKAAGSGTINGSLLDTLSALPYYAGEGPGSLSREWLESEFIPLIHEYSLPVTDILATLCEHIAIQISEKIRPHTSVLATGGGVYNSYLMGRLRHYSQSEIISEPDELIDFKEALVFAFLGLLRAGDEINCYASVTGAESDSCCGNLYFP